MTSTLTRTPETADALTTTVTDCPHCHKGFTAAIDLSQPPRLQGAKCPHCRLFVPARLIGSAGGAAEATHGAFIASSRA